MGHGSKSVYNGGSCTTISARVGGRTAIAACVDGGNTTVACVGGCITTATGVQDHDTRARVSIRATTRVSECSVQKSQNHFGERTGEPKRAC